MRKKGKLFLIFFLKYVIEVLVFSTLLIGQVRYLYCISSTTACSTAYNCTGIILIQFQSVCTNIVLNSTQV